MDTARRLYIYTVSGIGLAVFATGLVALLAALLAEVRIDPGDVLSAGSVTREQVSRAVALTVVGLPVWLLHWGFARAILVGADARARGERGSAIRALYLAMVQVITLVVVLTAALEIVRWFIGLAVGATDRSVVNGGGTVVQLLVAGALWTYHARIRASELRQGARHGAAAWLPRLYRYSVAWATLTVALIGASSIVWTILSVLVGASDLGSDDWWRWALTGALAQLCVGFVAWLLHWREGGGVIVDSALTGEEERTTRLRATYFGSVLLLAVAVICSALAVAVIALGGWVLGTQSGSDPVRNLENVIGPLVAVVPFVIAAWLHQRQRVHELLAIGASAVSAAKGVAVHVVALVGLCFLAAGVTRLLVLLLELAANRSTLIVGADSQTGAITTALGLLIAGGAAWLPAWASVLRSRSTDPVGEAGAAASGIHLYLMVGVSFVALVPCAALVLYRTLDALLGGIAERPMLVELAWPIAIILVAAAGGAYHGRLLLVDRRLTAGADVPEAEEIPTLLADDQMAIELLLRVPSGTDLPEVLEQLRGTLLAGASLNLVGGGSSEAARH